MPTSRVLIVNYCKGSWRSVPHIVIWMITVEKAVTCYSHLFYHLFMGDPSHHGWVEGWLSSWNSPSYPYFSPWPVCVVYLGFHICEQKSSAANLQQHALSPHATRLFQQLQPLHAVCHASQIRPIQFAGEQVLQQSGTKRQHEPGVISKRSHLSGWSCIEYLQSVLRFVHCLVNQGCVLPPLHCYNKPELCIIRRFN